MAVNSVAFSDQFAICKLFELANLLLLTSFYTKFACQASQHEYMVDLQDVVRQVFRELLATNGPQSVLVQLNHLQRWLASKHTAKPDDTSC